jgi:hypothetical protein
MSNYDIDYRLREFSESLRQLTKEVSTLKTGFGMNEMWDNSDLIRNWKISPRTLASWRSDGMIDYVQAGGKIWYPVDARNKFISNNYKKCDKA